MTIGEKIKQRRLELGISLRELARECDIAPSTALGWETGRSVPRAKYIPQLALTLKMDQEEFADNLKIIAPDVRNPFLQSVVKLCCNLTDEQLVKVIAYISTL